MEVQQSKKVLRKQLINHRFIMIKNYDLQQKKIAIEQVKRNLEQLLFQNSFKIDRLAGYYALKQEICCLDLLLNLKKKFKSKIYLPVHDLIPQPMKYYEFQDKESLIESHFKIKVPDKDKSEQTNFLNIALIPLLAFDSNLNRMGFGQGYQDRTIDIIRKNDLLTRNPNPTIFIGVAYNFQYIEQVPIEKHDQQLDFVITEKQIFSKIYTNSE